MRRAATAKNIYDKKQETFEFDGVWQETFGNPETNGAWLVWGPEKNGKTWITLMLTNYLSGFARTAYMSAEEGFGKDFKDCMKRAGITHSNKNLQFLEYETREEVEERLSSRKGPKILVIDNITVWADELRNGGLKRMLQKYPNVLFIFMAHEERGQPYLAVAKLCSKLAKIKIQVKGIACTVSGRCPGGSLVGNEERATLYHGQEILNQSA